MAYKKVILKSAQAEYRDIVSYLVEVLKSPQAAARFMNEFDYQLDLIAEAPEMFSLSRMPELAARGYRAAHVDNYLMLYKIQGQNVVVAHVSHQSQDYARLI